MMIIKVTCAIIVNNNKVLAAKRSQLMPHAGLWEFPGGKIEEGENAETCLHREIMEELQCGIIIINKLSSFVHNYEDKRIELIPFLCKLEDTIPVPIEHEEICWLNKPELLKLDWLPADLPIVKHILEQHLIS